jgi:tetratricopeptide (TPR) repeat protein
MVRLGLAIALGIAASAPARGSDDDEIARAHFATGLSYYDTGRWEPAAREFLEAYRLAPRPALLYNIARTYEKLDDPGRATIYYRRYLEVSPQAPERAQVVGTLEKLAGRVGTLRVRSSVAHAEVVVDGESIGAVPLPELTLSAGQHLIEVRKEGFGSGRATVDLLGRHAAEVEVDPVRIEVSGPGARRRLLLGVGVGVGVAVVVAVAATLIALFAGNDFSASARASCTGDCVLLGALPRWP